MALVNFDNIFIDQQMSLKYMFKTLLQAVRCISGVNIVKFGLFGVVREITATVSLTHVSS